MDVESFETELRRLRWQEPFQPFVVELVNGERIEVDAAEGLAFSGGAATFIAAGGHYLDFDCEEVARIVASQGAAST